MSDRRKEKEYKPINIITCTYLDLAKSLPHLSI